ncbi:sortilin-like isoform X2 [Mya arenaria]|uniref:sortilin-like isoform X2 n=1 Tax=Mya arenaria TaxID=6604 RepID=UPI0022E91FEF|nr:sortilin-like isoform X2 [Mya arenaria]
MVDKEGILMKMSRINILVLLCICIFAAVSALDFTNVLRSRRSVIEFDAVSSDSFVHHVVSEETKNINIMKRERRDTSTCQHEYTDKKYDDEHTFTNESKTAMALAWAGENDGTLVVVTSDVHPLIGNTVASTIYRSTDFGRTYQVVENITDVIKKHNGLQRHPLDSKKVYLVGEARVMYVTEDGGKTFTKVNLPFILMGEIIFHSSKDHTDHLLAFQELDLWVSTDNGHQWKLVKKGVEKAVWGIPPEDGQKTGADTPETIYFTYNENNIEDMILKHFLSMAGITKDYTLAKSEGADSVKDILQKVVSFERQGKFLYASTARDDNSEWRAMMVSLDYGGTFNEVQLPTIAQEQFYSLVEIENDIIFMHVDNPGDTGYGTLYTSASQGVIFSESLPRHLYPNFNTIHDFYKVQSMRGVYITSQMADDDSIHSMITYNQGADWQKIKQPEGAPCKDDKKECSLHIHGMYSMSRDINAQLPASEKAAIGIIMAHGHVGESLQITHPDVFVSSDGGYSWKLSLKGPHHYQIGDHGGLLVAVSRDEPSPNVIKFSTDEGNCWSEYKFTDKLLNFTGLLTEPLGKSSVVMLWGYVAETKKWEVHIIDFKDLINKKCTDLDYEIWMAHESHRQDEGSAIAGCLLGQKETFYRLKKDSFCYNGYDHVVINKTSVCECTREDYECDYGYYRPGGSDNCKKEPEFKGPEVDICYHGHDEKLVSEGYRKIPGDKCKEGYSPTSKLIDLHEKCDEFGNAIIKFDEGVIYKESDESKQSDITNKGFGKGIKIIAVILCLAILVLAAFMGVYFVRKFVLLKQHKEGYRYSVLSQHEQQGLMDNHDSDDGGDLTRDLDKAYATSTVKYDSDEELTTSSLPKTTTQPAPKKKSQPNGSVKTPPSKMDNNPFGSYHDDSDDDMLS